MDDVDSKALSSLLIAIADINQSCREWENREKTQPSRWPLGPLHEWSPDLLQCDAVQLWADRALPNTSPYRKWYELGCAFAKYIPAKFERGFQSPALEQSVVHQMKNALKPWSFRTKLELAAELVEWAAWWFSRLKKRLLVVVDGAYAKRPFLDRMRALGAIVVSRLRKDAGLKATTALRFRSADGYFIPDDDKRGRLPQSASCTLSRTHVHIDVSTPEGKLSGLRRNSVVQCGNLYTVDQGFIQRRLGRLSDALMRQVDDCLRAALDL